MRPHLALQTAVLALLSTSSLTSAKPLTVTSLDKSLSVVIDSSTGSVTALAANGLTLAASASATLAGTIDLQGPSAKAVSGGVLVSRLVCVHAEDVPCSSQQALVQELFSPRATSVGAILWPILWPNFPSLLCESWGSYSVVRTGWTLNISSPVASDDPTPLWYVQTFHHFIGHFPRIFRAFRCDKAPLDRPFPADFPGISDDK